MSIWFMLLVLPLLVLAPFIISAFLIFIGFIVLFTTWALGKTVSFTHSKTGIKYQLRWYHITKVIPPKKKPNVR